MQVEQRVKALEQEVEILKSQIQATLLDIQEQLLNSRYPDLRAPDRLPKSQESNTQVSATQVAETEPATLEPPAPSEEVNDPEPDTLERIVTMKATPEIPGLPRLPLEGQAVTAGETSSPEFPVDWATFTMLVEWVERTTQTVGPDGVRSLIDRYRQSGFFTPELSDALLDVVSLHTHVGELMANAPVEPNGERDFVQPVSGPFDGAQDNHALANDQESLEETEPSQQEPEQMRSVIVRLISGLKNKTWK